MMRANSCACWPDRRTQEQRGKEEEMAEATLPSAESALENQRIGPLQLRVAALCTLIQICDGYDINSIAWSVPSLTHVWGLKGSAFAVAFLWSSIGILVGALSGGPIGDRVGRKPLLVASITIFGLASLASAFADSLEFLTVTRFFTGLGIGGGFPGAATLTGDYAPHRGRALMIMASFTGAPLGGFLCGQGGAVLLRPRCCGVSTSRRGRPPRWASMSPRATRSRCCSAKAMPGRPCCCGSSSSAA